MKRLVTEDGSTTLYSEEYQEYYHTKSGALEESFKKFVKPCNLKPGAAILDIGFGLGYNSLAAIHAVKKISIIALEKDSKVLDIIQQLEVPESLEDEFRMIKQAAKNLHYKDEDIELTIMLGDATDTIKSVRQKFDAVFLDPFSPPKNPELWTISFFDDVKELMKKDAILATYSCARIVRDNLRTVGFLVKDGPVVGRRGPSTLAVNV